MWAADKSRGRNPSLRKDLAGRRHVNRTTRLLGTSVVSAGLLSFGQFAHTGSTASQPESGASLAPRGKQVPASSGRVTSGEIVSAFNRIRLANGLPAVKDDKAWDGACHLHDIYGSDNDLITHYEQSGRPGYTAAGAWAGKNAVLAYSFGAGQDDVWTAADPWATAPIHLSQMMSPALATIGAYQYTDPRGTIWNCLTTWPGYVPGRVLRTKAQRLWSYPGDGATGVPIEMQASESPTVPNGWVGLPTDGATYGGVTGPFVYLYWSGPEPAKPVCANSSKFSICIPEALASSPSPVTASLDKPDGAPVDTRLITQTDVTKAGYAGDTPLGSAMLVPVYPLKPRTTYTVHVTFGVVLTFPCPVPPPGFGVKLKPDWCAPKYPPFSAVAHFTTAG